MSDYSKRDAAIRAAMQLPLGTKRKEALNKAAKIKVNIVNEK